MNNINDILREAIKHDNSGDLRKADALYLKVADAYPENVELLFRIGTLKLRLRDFDNAVSFLRKSARLKPDYAEAHNNLGNAFLMQKMYPEAVKNYDTALKIDANIAEAHNNKGVAFRKLNKPGEAVGCFQQALRIRPDYAGAYNNMGAALKDLGEFEAAVVSIQLALSLNPDHVEALNNLGVCFRSMGKFEEAVATLKKAVELKPDYAEAHNNLGSALRNIGKLDEALASFHNAQKFKPQYVEAFNNLGLILRDKGKLDDAIACYNNGLNIDPENIDVKWNKSIALLLKGDYNHGWPEYETRFARRGSTAKIFPKPRWDGSPFKGKTVFVHAEQGYGDTFQFARFLPLIKDLGGSVVFECQKGLAPLLNTIKGFDKIVEKNDGFASSNEFDMHAPLLSLPGLLNVSLDNLPSKTPYIFTDSELTSQWHARLNSNAEGTFKVGIAWTGNPQHENDFNRSCPLSVFKPLSEIKGLTLFSLQKNETPSKINEDFQTGKIIDLADDLNSFSDTASVIANLDLVVAVDTAVVHLAGAMGKETWTLLPFSPDWRWLLNRNDSPWYPQMQLFRQPNLGDWETVIRNIVEELKKRVNKK